MPIERMWIARVAWLLVMVALVSLTVFGFVRSLNDPSLIDIPAFTGLFTGLGISLRTLIVGFLVVPSALAVGAAIWMFLGAKEQWFPLLLGSGLVAQYGIASGANSALRAIPGWQGVAAGTEVVAFSMLLFVGFLFPNGRFVPKWSVWPAFITIGLLATWPGLAGNPRLILVAPEQIPGGLRMAMSAFLGAFIALLIVAQRIRYTRFATPLERQQVRWLLLAFVVFFLSVTVAVIASAVLGPQSVVVGVAVTMTALADALVPVAAAIAIRRYRLYELDRVVSRAVSFTIVIGVLALLYVGGVIAIQALVPSANDLAVAASTLGAAAAFAPIRRRVEKGVERRFNRARFNAELELSAFSDRVANQVGLEALTEDLFSVVTHTVQPATTGLWVRGGR